VPGFSVIRPVSAEKRHGSRSRDAIVLAAKSVPVAVKVDDFLALTAVGSGDGALAYLSA